jgi:tetratricopeptide (TPR) repeat protein
MASADVYRIIGEFGKAIQYYSDALELCEGLCNDLTAAAAMVGLGLSYRAVGMWRKAMVLIDKAIKTYTATGDRKGLAFALWAKAGALRVAGRIPATIETFLEARRIFKAIRFESGLAYALAGLGGAHRVAGMADDSLRYYLKANEIFTRLGDTFGTAYTHCGIGNAYRIKGDFRRAGTHFRKATRLYASIGDIVSYSYTLWSMATLSKLKGDHETAKKHIAEARKNFRRTRDPRGLIYCDLADGEMAWIEGRDKSAIRLVWKALASATAYRFRLEQCHARLLAANVKKA